MFDALKPRRDTDYPERTWALDCLRRVLEGTLYSGLSHEFADEHTGGGEYIPLKKRKPSVRHNLCRLVVEDSVSLVFSEGHFPGLVCTDEGVRTTLMTLIKETKLPRVMQDAGIVGSVGSVAILMAIYEARVFFQVLQTEYLTPRWKRTAPNTLEAVTEKCKVKREVLIEAGYALTTDAEQWWFQRVWDSEREIWFHPWPTGDKNAGPREDAGRTIAHNLGFVPMVWIKNLPGPSSTKSSIDGAATLSEAAINTQIEMEYQLSQAGRGLKYAADPTLLIKEPAFAEQSSFVRSPAEAIVVSQDGDAKLLEIGGTAADAVILYCRALREIALEQMHGNRTNADKLSAAQSGRAMELMHQPMISVADYLRQSYGEDGLLELLRMVARVTRSNVRLKVGGKLVAPIPEDLQISLRWPPWFPPTGGDRVEEANALAALRLSGLISQKTGVQVVAESWDVEDVEEELRRIAADQAAIIAGTQISPTGRLQTTPNSNQGNGGDTPP